MPESGYAVDLSAYFVRVAQLESAGRRLANFIREPHNWMYVAGNYPLPKDIKTAMRLFDGDIPDATT